MSVTTTIIDSQSECGQALPVERTYGSCDMDCGAVATVPFRDMYEILMLALCQDCAEGR